MSEPSHISPQASAGDGPKASSPDPSAEDPLLSDESGASPEGKPKWVVWARWTLIIVLLALALSYVAVFKALLKIGLPLGILVYIVRQRLDVVEEKDRMATFVQRAREGETRDQVKAGAKKVGRRLGTWVLRFGGGFYGLVATVTFLVLQVRSFWEDSTDVAATFTGATTGTADLATQMSSQLWKLVLETTVRVGTDMIGNIVGAVVWPLTWIDQMGFWVAVPLMYVGMKALQWSKQRFPLVEELLTGEPAGVKKGKKASTVRRISFDDPDASSFSLDSSKEGEISLRVRMDPSPERDASSDAAPSNAASSSGDLGKDASNA